MPLSAVGLVVDAAGVLSGEAEERVCCRIAGWSAHESRYDVVHTYNFRAGRFGGIRELA